MEDFKKELEVLINKHSMENESNTPDYILAEYLIDSLKVFNKTTQIRNDWHSKEENNNNFFEKEI